MKSNVHYRWQTYFSRFLLFSLDYLPHSYSIVYFIIHPAEHTAITAKLLSISCWFLCILPWKQALLTYSTCIAACFFMLCFLRVFSTLVYHFRTPTLSIIELYFWILFNIVLISCTSYRFRSAYNPLCSISYMRWSGLIDKLYYPDSMHWSLYNIYLSIVILCYSYWYAIESCSLRYSCISQFNLQFNIKSMYLRFCLHLNDFRIFVLYLWTYYFSLHIVSMIGLNMWSLSRSLC